MPTNQKNATPRDALSHGFIPVVPGWDGGLRVDLPLPTSTNAIWRSNRGIVHLSKSYKNWMERASLALDAQRAELNLQSITGPFDVAMLLPAKKWLKADIDNRTKAALDWAKKAGLIEDDRFANRLVVEWGFPGATTVRMWMVPAEPQFAVPFAA